MSEENTQKSKIHNPYDIFYKSCMEAPDLHQPLLDEVLPEPIKDVIEKDSIKAEPNHFITKQMSEKSCDTLFSAKTKDDKDAWIFTLCEHQSSPSYWMAQRMLSYTLDIWNRYWDTHIKPLKKLAFVYPVVIYNGHKKYRVAQDIQSLFGDMKDEVEKFFTYKYHLINLRDTLDDDLSEQTYLNLFKYTLKHIRDKNISDTFVDTIMTKYPKAINHDKKNAYKIIENATYYMIDALEDENEKLALRQKISDNLKEDNLNELNNTMKHPLELTRQEVTKKVTKKVRKERDIEMVKNMLADNASIEKIMKYTGLSEAQIQKIKNIKVVEKS